MNIKIISITIIVIALLNSCGVITKFSKETTQWETYKNEKYDFEFSHPSTWSIFNPYNEDTSFFDEIWLVNSEKLTEQGYVSLGISVFNASELNSTLLDWVKANSVEGHLSPELSRIIIGEKEYDSVVQYYPPPYPGAVGNKNEYILHDDLILNFYCSYPDGYENLADLCIPIIKTFRFIK